MLLWTRKIKNNCLIRLSPFISFPLLWDESHHEYSWTRNQETNQSEESVIAWLSLKGTSVIRHFLKNAARGAIFHRSNSYWSVDRLTRATDTKFHVTQVLKNKTHRSQLPHGRRSMMDAPSTDRILGDVRSRDFFPLMYIHERTRVGLLTDSWRSQPTDVSLDIYRQFFSPVSCTFPDCSQAGFSGRSSHFHFGTEVIQNPRII